MYLLQLDWCLHGWDIFNEVLLKRLLVNGLADSSSHGDVGCVACDDELGLVTVFSGKGPGKDRIEGSEADAGP
jgi:hypothetical protein